MEPEPLNKNDMSAVAIYDNPWKLGNLKRDNAAAIATVMKHNLTKSKFCLNYLRTGKTLKIGPQ